MFKIIIIDLKKKLLFVALLYEILRNMIIKQISYSYFYNGFKDQVAIKYQKKTLHNGFHTVHFFSQITRIQIIIF